MSNYKHQKKSRSASMCSGLQGQTRSRHCYLSTIETERPKIPSRKMWYGVSPWLQADVCDSWWFDVVHVQVLYIAGAILPQFLGEGANELESSTNWVSMWVWAYKWCYSDLSVCFPKGGYISWTIRVKEPINSHSLHNLYRVSTGYWDLGLPSLFCMSPYTNCDIPPAEIPPA